MMNILSVSAANLSSFAPAIVWGCLAITVISAMIYSVHDKLKALNNRHHYISWNGDEVSVTTWNNGHDGLSPDGVPFYDTSAEENDPSETHGHNGTATAA